jgi:hypothetical protein
MHSQPAANPPPKISRFAAAALCFILPLPLAWFFGALVVGYWDYFDIGVSGARGFVVVFGYVPFAVIAFLFLGTAVHFSLRGSGIGPWRSLAAGFSAMLIALLCGFAYEVYRLRGYPVDAEHQHSMREFIVWFIRSLIGMRPNQALQPTALPGHVFMSMLASFISTTGQRRSWSGG